MKTKVSYNETLHDLVKINNDRIEGYKQALEELKDGDLELRNLFENMISASKGHIMLLSAELNAIGESTDADTTKAGVIYKAWLEVKSMFKGNDIKALITHCKKGEEAAQIAYESALRDSGLNDHLRELIEKQKNDLKSCYNKMSALRESY